MSLIEDDFDYEKIKQTLKNEKIKLIEIQRSKGYAILLANTAVFKLLATTLGAKNSPCKMLLFIPSVGPTSFPSPGTKKDHQ